MWCGKNPTGGLHKISTKSSRPKTSPNALSREVVIAIIDKGRKRKRVQNNSYAHFEQMARGHESVSWAIFLYNGYDMPNLDDLIKTIKESQKTLFILCGFPYAGKSFIAEALRRHTDIVFVSIDTIFQTHGFDWNTNKLPNRDEWQKIFNESYEESIMALTQGKNVLYDSTNQTIVSRNRLREVAHSVEANACVVYIKSSVETVWKRWEENQKKPTRSAVSKELIQMTIDQFEEPTVNENVLVIVN